MKKLIFLFLPVLVFACKGVEQYRASIEGLATAWDSTTADITEYSSTLGADLSSFSQAATAMTLGEDVMKNLKPEEAEQWKGAQSAFMQAMQAYVPLRTQVGDFLKSWGEKAAEVQALKDGLANGKLEGDIPGQVASLTETMTNARGTLAEWQTAYKSAHDGVQSASDTLKALYDNFTAAATSAKK